MPREQTIRCERRLVVPRGVEHHLHDALDLTVSGFHAPHVNAEAACDRRADLNGVELLSLDLAARDDIFSESLEDGLLLLGKAERLHSTEEPALMMPHGCEGIGQALLVPAESRPTCQFVDVSCSAPHDVRRFQQLSTARYAVNNYLIRRVANSNSLPRPDPGALVRIVRSIGGVDQPFSDPIFLA